MTDQIHGSIDHVACSVEDISIHEKNIWVIRTIIDYLLFN